MPPIDVVFGTVDAPQLPPSPLKPEQVLAGSPKTGSLTLGQSPDGNLSFNLWECSQGSFRWTYRSDEIIHVLVGGARITPVGGVARTVKPGDVVYFPRGTIADWIVDDYIKKLAVHRTVEPTLRQRVTGKMKKLVQRFEASR